MAIVPTSTPSKIRVGFARALHKRPVPTEYVDAAIDRIVQQVLVAGRAGNSLARRSAKW